ncbi:dipeptide epimerase [Candidatus Uabimicrobium sp. HlEnr_7]|uniref:dipeptide epimerase n=1 Tax=Candidatus Uabimicrobium helgolandensis TaxID=3095367 RepID=UPI003557DB1C
MQIIDIKVTHTHLPLEKEFRTALRTATEIPLVDIELISDSGKSGFASTCATTKVTGETISSICAAIKQFIFPAIVGNNVRNLNNILQKIQDSLPNNYGAKAGIDMAVYDLYCKSLGIKLHNHLGIFRSQLSSSMTISLGNIPEMCSNAQEAVDTGFTALKIKAGKNVDEDIKAIREIRNVVGKNISLRIDANQGWQKREAVRAIHALSSVGNIDFIEQPVKAHDLCGMKWIKDRVDIPIMADESVFNYYDAMAVVQQQAADFINIKLLKCGGIFSATKIVHAAESAGIACMLGCMMEGPKSIESAAMFACAHKNITMVDLDSLYFLREFTLPSYITYAKGNISIKTNLS